MSRRPNDAIGKAAGAVLAIVLIVAMFGGYGLIQTQDAIDESVAAQQQLACFQQARMCAAVDQK